MARGGAWEARQIIAISSPGAAHGPRLATAAQAVVGPAQDGGFWLLGLREKPKHSLFRVYRPRLAVCRDGARGTNYNLPPRPPTLFSSSRRGSSGARIARYASCWRDFAQRGSRRPGGTRCLCSRMWTLQRTWRHGGNALSPVLQKVRCRLAAAAADNSSSSRRFRSRWRSFCETASDIARC